MTTKGTNYTKNVQTQDRDTRRFFRTIRVFRGYLRPHHRRSRRLQCNMGIFSKTPKPNPKITVEGVEITFHLEYTGWWAFTYRGAEFTSFESALTLPTKMELDAILETLESLKPEMRTRLQKVLSEWGGSRLDDGESYSIDVQNFASDKTFTVSWSDGASWGDLGVDFTIKNHTITDESWGD